MAYVILGFVLDTMVFNSAYGEMKKLFSWTDKEKGFV
jgi:hypothetical protein